MSRRVLVIEPDAASSRMIERALTAGGFAPTSVPTIEASRSVLDAGPIDAVVVELRATNAEGADGVRGLRRDYPDLPLIVTGTLLTTSVAQQLVRIRVDDILPKPFTPRELLASVQRAMRHLKNREDGAMEYAAAMAAARRAIVEGRLEDAQSPLERARTASPLDAESMALFALGRELAGEDEDASRAYRASLALEEERVTDEANPAEGLARLAAYRGARPVASFEHRQRRTLWFVGDPMSELSLGPPAGETPDVTIFCLALAATETAAMYARIAEDNRAFLIATSSLSERLALRIVRSFERPVILYHSPTRPRLGSVAELFAGEGGHPNHDASNKP